MTDRMTEMVERYGEVVTKAKAAKILGRSATWINSAIKDGRLAVKCCGTMVDVRSIAEYIEAPAKMQEIGRKNRVRMRTGSEWAV